MKKIFFASAIAAATILPTSLNAQDVEKEFHMVITLQNGTTITLGHNDVKNITFNGEEIDITGNAVSSIASNTNEINELWQQLSQTSETLGNLLTTMPEEYATKPELEEAYMQMEQINVTITQLMASIKEDFVSQEGLEEVYSKIEDTNIALTQYMNVVKDEYVSNEELEEVYKQIEETKEFLTQAMNATDFKIQEATEEIWNAIQGENGLQEQMTQFYNSNKADIVENAKKIELLEDSLREIADPTNGESMMMKMNEALATIQAQIDALEAKIAELQGDK